MVVAADPDNAGEVGLLRVGELVWRSSGDRSRHIGQSARPQQGVLPADALVAACPHVGPGDWAQGGLSPAVAEGRGREGRHAARSPTQLTGSLPLAPPTALSFREHPSPSMCIRMCGSKWSVPSRLGAAVSGQWPRLCTRRSQKAIPFSWRA